jgi:hypothetical protein
MIDIAPVLNVRFFRTDAGNEPVREWLTDLPREHRRMIGTDIKTVQIGWPIGMPVVRKLDTGYWEVRIHRPGSLHCGGLRHGSAPRFHKEKSKNTSHRHGNRQAAQSKTMRHRK